MNKQDYTTALVLEATPQQVFNAVNNVRGWWQGEIEGNANKLNDEFIYRMADIHYSKQKLTELVPNEKTVWLVTDSKLKFTENPNEWTGTKIMFEILAVNDKTQLRFTHIGLIPRIECFDNCSNAWSRLIKESLYSLITTGKGTKVFG